MKVCTAVLFKAKDLPKKLTFYPVDGRFPLLLEGREIGHVSLSFDDQGDLIARAVVHEDKAAI